MLKGKINTDETSVPQNLKMCVNLAEENPPEIWSKKWRE